MAVLDEPLSPGDTVMGHATVTYGFLAELPSRERTVGIPPQEVTSMA